jgi:hypothetical protein
MEQNVCYLNSLIYASLFVQVLDFSFLTGSHIGSFVYVFALCVCFQAELVGASIADPPRPDHHSLDKGIINAILGRCHDFLQQKDNC